MHLWTRKILVNLGNHPHMDLDLGIFEGFFNIARQGIFHNLVYIHGKMIGSS